jgi:hypothetical protein
MDRVMTTRQQRRREERRARKEAHKAGKQNASPRTVALDQQLPPKEVLDCSFDWQESPARPTRAGINQANARHSTGPRTEEGKASSSRNAVRHGLSSARFLILDWENGDDFVELLANLRSEHQPRTQTEALLVERMAEHFWLSQRASSPGHVLAPRRALL